MMNIKLSKQVLVVCVGMVVSPCVHAGTISWGTSAMTDFVFYNDGVTPVVGSYTDPGDDFLAPYEGFLTGSFLQLIKDGAKDGIDGFDPSQTTGLPVASDDIVIGTSWMGEGLLGDGAIDPFFGSNDATRNGHFSTSATATLSSNDVFYIRAYTAVSPNYAGGAIPTTGFFGDAGMFVVTPQNDTDQLATFTISGYNLVATAVVPEPATALLFGLGMVTLAMRRRKKA